MYIRKFHTYITDINECRIEGSHNCGGGYACVNTPGNFTCDGMLLYEVANNIVKWLLFSIIDIDECTMETAVCVTGATCVNTPPGSFTCTCPPGFRGDGRASPDGSGCTGMKEAMSCCNRYCK